MKSRLPVCSVGSPSFERGFFFFFFWDCGAWAIRILHSCVVVFLVRCSKFVCENARRSKEYSTGFGKQNRAKAKGCRTHDRNGARTGDMNFSNGDDIMSLRTDFDVVSEACRLLISWPLPLRISSNPWSWERVQHEAFVNPSKYGRLEIIRCELVILAMSSLLEKRRFFLSWAAVAKCLRCSWEYVNAEMCNPFNFGNQPVESHFQLAARHVTYPC